MTQAFAAVSILALTVSLSLARPSIGPIRIHHSTAALLGALLTLSLHILPLPLALDALRLLAIPVVTIVALMLITLMAEHAGLFSLLARFIAQQAAGDGRLLFTYLFVAGVISGSIFTNDAAVLIFTPLVFELIEEVKDDTWTPAHKVPFYFSVLYVANIVGGLVISNPINIISASIFHIDFIEYARWMLAPALVSALVSFAGIALVFRRSIPRRYRIPAPAARARAQTMTPELAICAAVLALVLAGFAAEDATGIPVWIVAVTGAIALLAARLFSGRLEARPLLRGVGWDVLVFVVGIFLVARGLREIGVTRALGSFIASVSGEGLTGRAFGVGLLSAVCSAFANNHPTADTMTWVIRDMNAGPLETKILALAALIGGDLGPKMLPIGSLAALLWFGILRRRGVHVPYALYIRIGIPVTLIAVVLSLATLMLELS